jgi:putative hydrolase of the HAD superfamily
MAATATSCVVFDLDDTLYLERDYVRSGFCAVDAWCESNLRLAGIGTLAWKLFEEGRRGDIFDTALQQLGVAPEAATIHALVHVYRTHAPQIRPAADAISCLAHLKPAVSVAMITDGSPASQWNKIDALGIRDSFDSIVVTGEWGGGFSKPHPRAFLHVENSFPTAKRYYYVADNPAKDFTTPRSIGWTTVRIRRAAGLYSDRSCSEQFLDYELPDMVRLPDIVLQDAASRD